MDTDKLKLTEALYYLRKLSLDHVVSKTKNGWEVTINDPDNCDSHIWFFDNSEREI